VSPVSCLQETTERGQQREGDLLREKEGVSEGKMNGTERGQQREGDLLREKGGRF
jgi:hypothetical protein